MANSIKGRVFDERSRRLLPGLTVEGLTRRTSESLGAANTNADGIFAVAVNPRVFRALVEELRGRESFLEDEDKKIIGPCLITTSPEKNWGQSEAAPISRTGD